MDTLATVLAYYGLDPATITQKRQKAPIEIPNRGRDSLPALFHDLDYKVGAEVGTEAGLYAEALLDGNPGSTLYCVDPYRAYAGYRDYTSQARFDGFREAAHERLRGKKAEFVREFSTTAARGFSKGSLDYVFIDGNHDLPEVIADMAAWIPKVRKGGIVAGHDYCKRARNGYKVHVVEATAAWTSAYFIYPWFLLGRKDVIPGEVRDRPRSWFWINT